MKYIVVLLIYAATFAAHAKGNFMIVSDNLINALATVESNNNASKVGKLGEVGILQIRQCVLDDVNRIFKTKYSLEDTKDNAKSREICRKYLQHWGRHYEIKTGKKATDKILAMIWNGGPKGPLKNISSLERYWEKVQLCIA